MKSIKLYGIKRKYQQPRHTSHQWSGSLPQISAFRSTCTRVIPIVSMSSSVNGGRVGKLEVGVKMSGARKDRDDDDATGDTSSATKGSISPSEIAKRLTQAPILRKAINHLNKCRFNQSPLCTAYYSVNNLSKQSRSSSHDRN